MKKNNITTMAIAAAALMTAFPAATTYAQKSTGWGDFKLFLDPGHSATENRGLWGYSEAQKVFSVAQYIKGYLTEYTDMPAENLKLCRNNEVDIVGLEERSDMANAWAPTSSMLSTLTLLPTKTQPSLSSEDGARMAKK